MTSKDGQVGIANHSFLRDRHVLLRIRKAGKVMCEVEQWHRRDGWSDPVRRKITEWWPLPPDLSFAQLSDLHSDLRQLHERLIADEQRARVKYTKSLEAVIACVS